MTIHRRRHKRSQAQIELDLQPWLELANLWPADRNFPGELAPKPVSEVWHGKAAGDWENRQAYENSWPWVNLFEAIVRRTQPSDVRAMKLLMVASRKIEARVLKQIVNSGIVTVDDVVWALKYTQQLRPAKTGRPLSENSEVLGALKDPSRIYKVIDFEQETRPYGALYPTFYGTRQVFHFFAEGSMIDAHGNIFQRPGTAVPMFDLSTHQVFEFKNGRVKGLRAEISWQAFMWALTDIEVARVRRCPLPYCGRFFYADRKNRIACCPDHASLAATWRYRGKLEVNSNPGSAGMSE